MVNNRRTKWQIGWQIVIVLPMIWLAGCGDSIEEEVTAKLTQATHQPTLPVVTQRDADESAISYQAGNNPFDNPVRAYAHHIANSAISAMAQQQAQADKQAGNQTNNQADKQTDNKQADKPATSQDSQTPNKAQSADKHTSSPPSPANHSLPPMPISEQPLGDVVVIDNARPRQPLEMFELSQLAYQGNLSDGERMIAIIKSPDGRVHQVAQGQYLGRHHGQVVSITPMAIVIHEALMAADGRYYRRDAMMRFGHK